MCQRGAFGLGESARRVWVVLKKWGVDFSYRRGAIDEVEKVGCSSARRAIGLVGSKSGVRNGCAEIWFNGLVCR